MAHHLETLVFTLSFAAAMTSCKLEPGDGPEFAEGSDGADGIEATDAGGETAATGGTDAGEATAGESGDGAGSGDSGGGEGNGATPQECGNGTIEGDEECDQNDFGFRTCQTYGFMAGMLACKSDCSVDPSTCSAESICGDAMITGIEQCEPDDLAGESCDSLALGSGELACAADCSFDATLCSCKGLGEPCFYDPINPGAPGGCCPAGFKGNQHGSCQTFPFQKCL